MVYHMKSATFVTGNFFSNFGVNFNILIFLSYKNSLLRFLIVDSTRKLQI